MLYIMFLCDFLLFYFLFVLLLNIMEARHANKSVFEMHVCGIHAYVYADS